MTDQQKESLKKIDKICRLIGKLNEQDLLNVRNIAEEQKWYIHPLKHRTQNLINTMGEGNHKTVSQLKEVRATILEYTEKYKKLK